MNDKQYKRCEPWIKAVIDRYDRKGATKYISREDMLGIANLACVEAVDTYISSLSPLKRRVQFKVGAAITDELRKEGRHGELFEADKPDIQVDILDLVDEENDEPLDTLLKKEELEQLSKAMGNLLVGDRCLIEERFFANKSISAIAKEYRLTEGSVRRSIRESLIKLRGVMNHG